MNLIDIQNYQCGRSGFNVQNRQVLEEKNKPQKLSPEALKATI